MPMMPDHFPNFYLGAAAEAMFAGEMYLLGYEAAKFSPDFGIDFSVTNAARHKFYSEPAKSSQIQVKSTLGYKGNAKIFIDRDDFHYLCESPNRYLVCYIFHDFYKQVDMDSANYRADMAELALQKDIARYEAAQMEDGGAGIKRNYPEVIFELRYRKRTVFWLNGKQLEKGLQENDWRICENEKFSAELNINDDVVALSGNQLFAELMDLKNIMSEPSSRYSFQCGRYSYAHV